MSQSSTAFRSDHSPVQEGNLAPHNVEAEEAVLGSMLLNPECYGEVFWLQPSDFFLVRHGWIWEAMQALVDRKDPVDQLTVVSELEQRGRLAETGGAAYVISLMNKTPSALNVEGYGHIVERMSLRRRLIEAAQRVARVAHSDETEIEEVIAESEKALAEATIRRIPRQLTVSVKDVAREQLDSVMRAAAGEKVPAGLATGIVDFDRLTGGFRSGDLILVAARPGMGKSSLLHQVAAEMARGGSPVGIVGWEMDQESVTTRLLSREANIPYTDIRDRRLTADQLAAYMAAFANVESWPIYLEADVTSRTPSGMRRAGLRLRYEYGIKALFVDYIQLMQGDWRIDNRVQEISQISLSLKALARELSIPVIAASQLSRAVEGRSDKRPMLSDLRESGSLEQDSDMVCFIYRDNYYDASTLEGNKAEIAVAKHRNGPTGTIDTIWQPEKFNFANATLVRVNTYTDESWVEKSNPAQKTEDGPILNVPGLDTK